MAREKRSALNNFFLIFFLFLSLISIFYFPQLLLSDSDRSQASSRPLITDSLKRKVEIPLRVNRVLSLQPEISRIVVALGGGKCLVGIDRFLRFEDHLFP